MENICKNCKNCIPGTTEIVLTTTDSSGNEVPWAGMGDQCNITKCSMWDVQSCTQFEEKKGA